MATAGVYNQVDLPGSQVKTVDIEKAQPAPLPFDPVKLKDKYTAERDKRLQHGGGIDQYRLVENKGIFSHYLNDPWVEPGFTREPVSEHLDVVVVGGGYGAQLVAVRLIEAGVKNIRLIEKVLSAKLVLINKLTPSRLVTSVAHGTGIGILDCARSGEKSFADFLVDILVCISIPSLRICAN